MGGRRHGWRGQESHSRSRLRPLNARKCDIPGAFAFQVQNFDFSRTQERAPTSVGSTPQGKEPIPVASVYGPHHQRCSENSVVSTSLQAIKSAVHETLLRDQPITFVRVQPPLYRAVRGVPAGWRHHRRPGIDAVHNRLKPWYIGAPTIRNTRGGEGSLCQQSGVFVATDRCPETGAHVAHSGTTDNPNLSGETKKRTFSPTHGHWNYGSRPRGKDTLVVCLRTRCP